MRRRRSPVVPVINRHLEPTASRQQARMLSREPTTTTGAIWPPLPATPVRPLPPLPPLPPPLEATLPPLAQPPDGRWHRQLHAWEEIVDRFKFDYNRYDEFSFLQYMDLDCSYVQNYVNFLLDTAEPIIKGRLKHHLPFWKNLGSPPWLLETIEHGVKIPFLESPPPISLSNNKTALQPENVKWVQNTITEFLRYGFIQIETEKPYCVMPLQVKETVDKKSLIFDMSALNAYVNTNSFKLEGWEEMFEMSKNATCGIKFDLKKFYHEIDLAPKEYKYYGFKFPYGPGDKPTYFVWTTLPYGYTRAPFIARSLMKPLIAHWRRLGASVCVFYDDGMAVAADPVYLQKLSLQMHCDLLRAGLVPGAQKCLWQPQKIINWNGLTFDFTEKVLRIMTRRILATLDTLTNALNSWPKLTFRQVACCVGKVVSLKPVYGGLVQIRTKMLQTFVNIRHFKELNWDQLIRADFGPLYTEAYEELLFWLTFLKQKNSRKFIEPAPTWLAWTDASEVAIAGFAVELAGLHPPCFSADNWLLADRDRYTVTRHCASLQMDALPWSGVTNMVYRDKHDLDPTQVGWSLICHRNLQFMEKIMDSNARELIAIVYFLASALPHIQGKTVTVHTDNMNAAIIGTSGSNKPRLNSYASLIANICTTNDINLHITWIPRDLNNIADFLSKTIDYEDYSITDVFYATICSDFGLTPLVDLFANTKNTKARKFFSLTYCPGCLGVDAFNYDWSKNGLNWIFAAPRLILRILRNLQNTQAEALLLVPQWKTSYFYPILNNFRKTNFFKRKLVYGGEHVFISGTDTKSYFGPHYNGNVEIWHLNFI